MMGIYSSMQRKENFFAANRLHYAAKRPGHRKTHPKNVAKKILQPLPR